MTNKYKLKVNWQVKIPYLQCSKNLGRDGFSLLKNRAVLLACNVVNESGRSTGCGKLILVSKNKIENIFETNNRLWSYVLDGNYVYFVSFSEKTASRFAKKAILFKFNLSHVLEWKYRLNGTIGTLPVVSQDSIFIADYVSSIRRGNLYRLNKDGNLIFEKQLEANAAFEPYIFEDRKELVLGCGKLLEIIDFEGNVIKQKEVNQIGTILFSHNAKGELFAAINHSIVALDNNLNVLWEYKPEIGWADEAPVFDSEENSYSLLNMKRLVSLDCNGKERWMVPVSGHGRWPLVISDDDVVIFTSSPGGGKSGDELSNTNIEIFSKDGEKLLEYGLPGSYVQAVVDNNTLFVVINSILCYPKKEAAAMSVKVFSLRLRRDI